MTEYKVELPLNAKIVAYIEAESEEEAIEKALEQSEKINLKLENDKDCEVDFELEEYNVFDKLLEGNFFYGIIREATAEEL